MVNKTDQPTDIVKLVVPGKTKIKIVKPELTSDGPGWTPALDDLIGKDLLVVDVILSNHPAVFFGTHANSRGPRTMVLLKVKENTSSFIDADWATLVPTRMSRSRKGNDLAGKKITRGTVVKVAKPSDISESPGWVPRMDVLDGNTVIVSKVLPGRKYIECIYNKVPLRYILNTKWISSIHP